MTGTRLCKAGLGRRRLLVTAPLVVALTAAGRGRTVASIDWGISETLFALGIPVAAAADTQGYARVVGSPATPATTRNLGLWSAPNLELLQALAPDLTLIQNWQAPLLPLLRQIGPVEMVSIYTRTGSPYDHAAIATRHIAARLAAGAEADNLIAAGERAMVRQRARLGQWAGRPVLIVKPLAGASFMAFGQGSIFQGALDRLGLANAWTQPPVLLAGASIIDITTLAVAFGDAQVVVIDGQDPTADQPLYRSRLWASLPFVRAGRVTHLPPLWEFGALPTAFRFAQSLSTALLQETRA